MAAFTKKSYLERAKGFTGRNVAAMLLLQLMDEKQSNLCVSVDVTKTEDLLRIVDEVGPHVCLIKTHIDIVEDFNDNLIHRLKELSEKHKFLIFEDRKFADIGNTVELQYSAGVHKISSWAHITNAHPVPGPSVVTGLARIGQPLGRGLLLLAEMSSEGTLATGHYTEQAIAMASKHKDFVIGFIAMRRLTSNEIDDDFLILTPGVGLDSKGDGKGQQYKTPREVILDRGCDVIIVGRGIYGKGNDVKEQAERYRKEGWVAYQERIGSPSN